MERARRRMVGFVATLRDNGFTVGAAEAADGLAALEGVARPAQARDVLRAVFCGTRRDWDGFDALFDAFWMGARVRTRARVDPALAKASQRTLRSIGREFGPGTGAGDAAADPGEGAGQGAPQGRLDGASRHEAAARADLGRLSDPAALAEAQALAARLARRIAARLTRRRRAAARGTVDLRATLRAARETGAPLRLARRRPRREPLRLALLVDASGSMGPYAGVFLRFACGLLSHFRRAEGFVFHTRLVHVSPALRERDAGRAMDRLGLMAEGAGGGTRIGESLGAFNDGHAARALRGRSAAIILSDGCEADPPERLAAEMARLRRRTRRVVWLNPLAGGEGYAPTARGMAAALPFVTLFAPARTLADLAALEPALGRL